MLKKGDRVGDLTFTDSEGTSHRLSDFGTKRGIVFFFYPMDFSPGCTKEACHFRDYHREIVELGGEVFGVSGDSAESHSKFSEKHRLPYPLISDADGALRNAFGTSRLGGLLGSKRVSFVVSPTGEVVDVNHSELSMIGHVERVIEVLRRTEEAEG